MDLSPRRRSVGGRVARWLGAAAAIAAFSVSAPAHAAFDAVYAFGDSLSDTGNAYAATGQPTAPYYQGRYSNGPLAVERLAGDLGVPLIDLAVAGATTGLYNSDDPGSASGVLSQLADFQASLAGSSADPNSLYVIWAGGNDLLPPADPAAAIAPAISNLVSTVQQLYTLGARKFLLPLQSDLGLTPAVQADGPAIAGQVSFLSRVFDANLAAHLFQLEGLLPGARISVFDTLALQSQVVANPAAYGLTNTTRACFDGATVCADPARYFYWDDIHPTAAIHAALGDAFAAEVMAVPEPQTDALMLAGLAAVGAAVRRRRRARR